MSIFTITSSLLPVLVANIDAHRKECKQIWLFKRILHELTLSYKKNVLNNGPTLYNEVQLYDVVRYSSC